MTGAGDTEREKALAALCAWVEHAGAFRDGQLVSGSGAVSAASHAGMPEHPVAPRNGKGTLAGWKARRFAGFRDVGK